MASSESDPDASVSCPSRTISFSRRISDHWPPSEGSRRATRSLIEFEPTSIAAMFFDAAIIPDRMVALLSWREVSAFPFADRPRLFGVAVSHYQVEGDDSCDWTDWEAAGRTK